MKVSYLASVWILSALLWSCSVQDDEAPEIISVTVNGIAEDHPHALAGAETTFHIVLRDDQDLGQCKLTFSPSLHGHAEEAETDLLQCPTVGEWEVMKIENLSGAEDYMTYTITLPDSIQGTWDMTVEVADKGGNLSEVIYPLHVQNDNMPFIGVDEIFPAPDADGMVYLNLGETLQITGDVVDTDDLASVEFEVWHADTLYWNFTASPMTWTFALDEVSMPLFINPGHFELVIRATDLPGWTYYKWLEIHVEE